jgi:hypothetical protein
LSASLSTETLRKLKREHGTVQAWWDSESLSVKTLREIMLKESEEKTWDRARLRKETLQNRKEYYRSQVLKNS